ncbi:thioester reductase [Burkholderia mayonis]|uniref:Thioester reductase n=1 Tax=Burkholderia mayonis TaxID=1385591 RepID=A0A1B4G185_9BURK|nr:thioester reductase [Burkholderia mayonis]KVE52302.1 thioester reductase [Burkholderia mayonis]
MSSSLSIAGDGAAVAAPEDRSHACSVFWIAGYARLPDGARRGAEHLGADWRVCELDGEPSHDAPPTVERLAERLLEQIVARQPHGPYRLSGWSSGGVLAYEIAVQLTGRDEAVEFLGIIDAPWPAAEAAARLARGVDAAPGARLVELIRSGCGADRPRDMRSAEWSRLFDGEGDGPATRRCAPDACDVHNVLAGASATLGFDEIASRCREAGLLPPALRDLTDPQLLQWLDRWAALDHALARYEPFPLSLPVHVFELRGPDAGFAAPRDRADGWAARLQQGEIRFVDVPAQARHAPKAGDVAQAIGRAIARALQDARRAVADGAHDGRRRSPEADYHPHMPIQRGTSGRAPVVLIPGAGDNVATFVPFASAVEPGWPIHGLQPRGLDGVLAPHASVEAAARAYLPVVERLAADAREPVHLIGHSFGGWVAMEIACRLQASGRPPASLTVVDTEAPASDGRLGRSYTFESVAWNLVCALEAATGRSLGIERDALFDAPRSGQWAMLHRGMVDARIIRRGSGPRDLQGIVRTYGTALRTAYRPAAVYTGRATLVLAADCDDAGRRLASADALSGWRRFAPRTTVWRCPGNHYTMLRPPHVGRFAQWWQRAVRAEAEADTVAASAAPHAFSVGPD